MILSLDLGTTGNRALLFDQKGNVVFSAYRPLSSFFPKPGYVEQDPLEILSGVLACLADVFSFCDSKTITAIGITNQRETTILWDKRTGKPIYNAIVWQCRRSADRCAELSSYKKIIKEKTGLFLDPYFSATKIEWILKERADLRLDVLNGHVLFGTVDSFILWHLTGRSVHATDVSNASRTLLFNLSTCDYDPDLLVLFNIPFLILPQVLSSSGLFGMTDQHVVGAEIPIMGVIGDQQASLFAQCGFDRSKFKNTYGTGLFLCATTGSEILQTPSLLTTVAWRIGDAVHYAVEGSVFMGGALISWLKNQLSFFESASDSESLALSVEDTGGVYFVPALSGLGAPYWDPFARGVISGLTAQSGKAHITRAALESLAYQSADVVFAFESEFPHFPITSLSVDGGVAANRFLMQFQADILQRPIHVSSVLESTALGAAGMAGLAVSFWTESEFFSLYDSSVSYSPLLSCEKRDMLYSSWKKSVHRSLMHA